MNDWETIRKLRLRKLLIVEHGSFGFRFGFSPDGSILVTPGGEMRAWESTADMAKEMGLRMDDQGFCVYGSANAKPTEAETHAGGNA